MVWFGTPSSVCRGLQICVGYGMPRLSRRSAIGAKAEALAKAGNSPRAVLIVLIVLVLLLLALLSVVRVRDSGAAAAKKNTQTIARPRDFYVALRLTPLGRRAF